MKINFKCDVCEHDVIEEVLNDVTQYSIISELEKFPDGTVAIAYDELTNTEYGELSHYQCMNCGKTLKNHGVTITTPEELYELLECNDMLKGNKCT